MSTNPVIRFQFAPGKQKESGPRVYALTVVGDSMENPRARLTYPDGAVIVVDPDAPIISGRCVVARPEGSTEATFLVFTGTRH